MDRDRAIELLNDNHSFPGAFQFRVVVRPGAQAAVVSAIASVGGDELAVRSVDERPSREGNYTSVHVLTHVERAELVLEVYAVLGGLDEVVMAL
jgi:putative lipoic acid-binding regulatory protein